MGSSEVHEVLPETVIFTACSVNYLDKAMAMCQSVRDHHPAVDLVILLVDRKRPVTLATPDVRLLWAEDVGFPEYLQCAFKYNIIELNTALKPFVAMKLLENHRKVIYLDPDVCVFSSLDSVIVALDHHATAFTPHALSPYVGAGRPDDQDLLRFGCFNLGFFAANNSADALALLSWWHQQCVNNCFYEPQAGLGVDQKWMDLAPAFFDGVHILKDPGLNVAFWNLHERRLSCSPEGWWVNDAFPLVFVHFSSFVEADRAIVADKQTRHAAGSRPDFAAAGDVYRRYLAAAKNSVTVDDPAYGYAHFDDGAAISPALRRFYAVFLAARFAGSADPFPADGPVRDFARANRLLSSRSAVVAHTNFKAKSAYGKERKVIASVFRLALRVLGPDRYFSLLRYLAHYSSIFNQEDLIRH